MMLVLVGLLKQASENGFCSVTTVFLCFVAGVFVVSAFLHPQVCVLVAHLYVWANLKGAFSNSVDHVRPYTVHGQHLV